MSAFDKNSGSVLISLDFNFPTLYFPYTLISQYFNFPSLISSDEPELEFSSSSRAEQGKFRVELSWGTLIFELKPSWTENFLTHLFTKFLSSEVLYHDFMII